VLVDSAVVGAVKKLDDASLLSRGRVIEVSIWDAVAMNVLAVGPKSLGGCTELSRLLGSLLNVGFCDADGIWAEPGQVRDDNCFLYHYLEVAIDVL
jgi:hypothetical protein